MPPVELFPLLLPFCLVCAGALAALGCEAFLGRNAKHEVLPWICALFLVAAGAAQAFTGGDGQLHGMLAMDRGRAWLCAAIIASALLGQAGLQQSLRRDGFPGGEPYGLMLLATAGAMLMVMATDTIALFLALELASLSVYALVGLRRHRRESNEGLFKYFAMGAVFSAVFLYGAALTYGATGSTHFGVPVIAVPGAVAQAGLPGLLILGQGLMIIGLLFKIGAVPFHFWSPDAYTGAPAAVTGFMGAAIKVGGFAALGCLWLNLAAVASGTHPGGVLPLTADITITKAGHAALRSFEWVFLLAAMLSLFVGNFSALRQTSARRMVAFSSVAHAGYMLLAFALPIGNDAFQLTSLWYYLVGYAIATAGVLTAISALAGREDIADDHIGLSGQGRAHPFYGLVITVFLVSFAGIPPTAGFLGKYLVFAELVAKGKVGFALLAMLLAVVGATYYFRLIITLWSGSQAADRQVRVPGLSWGALAAGAVAVVVLVLAPDLIAPAFHGPVAATPAAAAGAPLAPAVVALPVGAD